MNRWRASVITALLLACGAGTAIGAQQEQSIVVASTTSTQDSGLFGYLLPLGTKSAKIERSEVPLQIHVGREESELQR